MATRALQQKLCYLAWNTSTNVYVTGDVANHSTSWAKDGTRSATTNSAAEVDATNMPGLYSVTMTATETDCIEGVLGGKSSTSNVVLIPTMVAFDYLNTSAPATAGVPDVNVKNMNNVAATSITTINANQGTTQPINFTGTAGSALTKADMVDIAGVAVSTSTAQIGVNAVQHGGTVQTGRDIGASVLLSAGAGAGQLDFTSGVVKANATQWLGGTIPAVNVTGVPLVDLKYTLGTISPATAGSVRADQVTGAVGSVTGAVGSVTGAVGSVTGAVGSVTGNVGGNVTGSVGSVVATVAANLTQILGTALTETAGQIAAGFKKVFDVAAPVFTAASVNQTGDSFARLGAPAGASVSADIAAAKADTAAIKTQTDKMAFTVANQINANVLDWKSATAPAMTGDAFARLGAPAGASVSADIAAVKSDIDGGVTLTSGERNSVADAMLDRDMSTGTDSGSTTVRTVRQALRFLRNKWAISTGTLTVYKENDATASWTATVATDVAAVPIVGNDPAGP